MKVRSNTKSNPIPDSKLLNGSFPHRVLKVSVLCTFSAILTLLIWYFVLSFRIKQLDRDYDEIQIGDPSSEVTQLLGSPDSVRHGSDIQWISLLPADLQDRCTKQYAYTVKTWFLPITWLVYFDENSRVIMKWRLD